AGCSGEHTTAARQALNELRSMALMHVLTIFAKTVKAGMASLSMHNSVETSSIKHECARMTVTCDEPVTVRNSSIFRESLARLIYWRCRTRLLYQGKALLDEDDYEESGDYLKEPIILGDLFLLSPVMQRWKEQYFVNVGYDCGLTIAGSYYVRFSCVDGSINGYYYDPNSSKRRAQARRRGSRPPPPKTTPLIKRNKGKSALGKLTELEDKATDFFTGKKNALVGAENCRPEPPVAEAEFLSLCSI
ncbi:vacuolar import/degradation protein Vid24, partial [Tanacetum coccineum]